MGIASARAHVVAPKLSPALPGSITFSGRLQNKLSLCLQNRILAQDVEAVIAPYELKTEIGSGDWRCEYWGKWFTSLALADSYHSTNQTRSKMKLATDELLATVAPDGYLGTRQPQYRLQGWDVWGCKYALLGLLADIDRTKNPAVLQACEKEVDVLIKEFGPGKVDIANVGDWNGLPASSVLGPVVMVYERTGNLKYLDFAKYIVSCWSKPSKRLPHGMRLIQDALLDTAPSQMCAPKAYEMMSCFEGLCELYKVTGSPNDLQAAINLAHQIEAHEETIVGVGTRNEVWFDGKDKQTGVVDKPMETCVTETWMRLCYKLLQLTGDPHYADELEKNLDNGLLGAMMPQGNWWAYFSGLMGVRVPSYVQHADVGLSCCVTNGPRGLMLTPKWAFMNSSSGPVVNLYSPAIAHLAKADLMVAGDYPVGDIVTITVNPKAKKRFTLTLRIPSWSHQTKIQLAGKTYFPNPGYFKINRRWHQGNKVEIHFDMKVRVRQMNHFVAYQRGPIVLSLDSRLNPLTAKTIILPKHLQFVVDRSAAKRIGAWMAFRAHGLTFCDYASAGNGFSESNTFRTWIPKTVNLMTVFQTGQTWQTLTHASEWTNLPPPRPRILDPRKDLALAVNGATAISDSEYALEPGCTALVNDGVIAVPSDFSNRWHSSLLTPHPHWVEIHLAKPAMIGRVILHFADPAGYPVDFQCSVRLENKTTVLFSVKNNALTQLFTKTFPPIMADSFRLTISSSANPKYPNAAQVSEIELYSR